MRPAPICPELAKLLPDITIRRASTAARAEALTGEEQASPLARRIYDLRHACLSLWLNARRAAGPRIAAGQGLFTWAAKEVGRVGLEPTTGRL
jgi:hypothetical protein